MTAALDQVRRWPAKAAAGVTSASGTLAVVGPHERGFQWASVTKLLTTLAVLVAIEEGSADLDQPAGPPGATLMHLMSHSSGLASDDDTVLAEPGTRRIYSNRGIEIAASLVETETRLPFLGYLREAVLEPLHMSATAISGSPAYGASGPLDDLLDLARELIDPTLLTPGTLERATSVVLPGLDGILPGYGQMKPNDWGLGFELRDSKAGHWSGALTSTRTFGHFGQSGSFLWVDPERSIACCSLADRDFGPWAKKAWPEMSDAVIQELPRM